MFSFILSKSAEKNFSSLPKTEQKKVNRKLLALQKNPLAGKPLKGQFQGFYSLKAWPYRIIYTLNKPKNITVHKILHRQSVYN